MADETSAGEGVDLETFVRETLVDIVRGIQGAKHDQELGRFISPLGGSPVKAELVGLGDHCTVSAVEFDIAVTAARGGSGGGRAVLRVPYFETGGEGRRETSNTTISRVRFGAMIELPGSRFPKLSPARGTSEYDSLST